MAKETNLDKIRDLAITLLYMDPEPCEELPVPIFIKHPFTNTSMVMYKGEDGTTKFVDILNDDVGLEEWRKGMKATISAASLIHIYMALDNRYRLAFFRLIKNYLSEQDFSRLWASIWTDSEGVNSFDVLSRAETMNYFRKCAPKYLMDAEDLSEFNALPDQITVYRGICPRKDKPMVSKDKATRCLSWTLSKEKAEWFSTRFRARDDHRPGVVYEATIEKPHILAFFDGRGEREVVVDYNHLENIHKVS